MNTDNRLAQEDPKNPIEEPEEPTVPAPKPETDPYPVTDPLPEPNSEPFPTTPEPTPESPPEVIF